MIVDGILFIGILLALHFYRNKHPNFLFFPQRAMFFLPPDTDNPGLSVLKVNYDDVKDHPLSTEFNRILMTIACIVLYVPWKFLLNMLLQDSSMLLFYISIIIGCYMCKIGVNIISISVYNKKVCVLVSVGLNALFYLLMITMEGIEGLYD